MRNPLFQAIIENNPLALDLVLCHTTYHYHDPLIINEEVVTAVNSQQSGYSESLKGYSALTLAAHFGYEK